MTERPEKCPRCFSDNPKWKAPMFDGSGNYIVCADRFHSQPDAARAQCMNLYCNLPHGHPGLCSYERGDAPTPAKCPYKCEDGFIHDDFTVRSCPWSGHSQPDASPTMCSDCESAEGCRGQRVCRCPCPGRKTPVAPRCCPVIGREHLPRPRPVQ